MPHPIRERDAAHHQPRAHLGDKDETGQHGKRADQTAERCPPWHLSSPLQCRQGARKAEQQYAEKGNDRQEGDYAAEPRVDQRLLALMLVQT